MTETELRQRVAETMRAWLGCSRGDATHRRILDIYNGYTPLPRGYRVQVQDNWCAAAVSAAGIAAGLTDIMPVECSCAELIRLYKGLGRWIEDDGYRPREGDLIFYAWKDDGRGECLKSPNHVGLVTGVTGDVILVAEGNMGPYSVCGTRKMRVNGRYIRGYGCPDYGGKADGEGRPSQSPAGPVTAPPEGEPRAEGQGGEESMKLYRYVAEMPEWAREACTKAIRSGIIKLDAAGACSVWECNLQPLVWMDRMGLLG